MSIIKINLNIELRNIHKDNYKGHISYNFDLCIDDIIIKRRIRADNLNDVENIMIKKLKYILEQNL